MTERVRILGIDPGSRKTGFGVIDAIGGKLVYVASGAVCSVDGEFPDRLRMIFSSVQRIATDYRPDVLAIESVFVHKNAQSALKLGHARAAALCATFFCELEVCEYAPREIKQAVVGTGSASKGQVQHMITSLLELDGPPSPDAADALAAAVCHGHRRRLDNRLSSPAAVRALR